MNLIIELKIEIIFLNLSDKKIAYFDVKSGFKKRVFSYLDTIETTPILFFAFEMA